MRGLAPVAYSSVTFPPVALSRLIAVQNNRSKDNKMRSLPLFVLLVSITSTLATPGGRCDNAFLPSACICLDRGQCIALGGSVDEGTPGRWPCPWDADNIIGCSLLRNCPGMDHTTYCSWREGCNPSHVLPSKPNPRPVHYLFVHSG
jgi:hypothetical protein